MKDQYFWHRWVMAGAVFVTSFFGYQINSQAKSTEQELWNIQREGVSDSLRSTLSFITDLNRLEKGDLLQLQTPSGDQVSIRLSKVQSLHLGGTLLQGYSSNNGSQLDLLVSGDRGFGELTINGNTSYLIHSEALKPTALVADNSITMLSSKLEIKTLLSRALTLQSGPAIAWFTPEFENKYGLSTTARLQYIVSRINQVRAKSSLLPVDLITTRKIDAYFADTLLKSTGATIASATALVADENIALVAAVLPSSRSVKTGVTATAFATIINPGNTDALNCGLVMNGANPAGTFSFQQTDASNLPVGTPDQTLTIAANAAQSFVFSFTASSVQTPGLDLPIEFSCSNRQSAVIISGLNTLFFSASDTDVPDIIAVSETGSAVGLNTEAGVVDMIDREKDGAFVVATSNVGIGAEITVTAESTAPVAYPVSLLVCQTDPNTGACLATPAAQVTLTIGAGGTPSFAIFANSNTVWQYDPAGRRVNILFKEGAAIRGSTSVALRTLQGTPDLPVVDIDYVAIAENLPAHFTQTVLMGPGQTTAIATDNTPASNPVTNAGATLGRVLFYDKRLSINDTVSCASCHGASVGFSDSDVLSVGFEGGLTGRHSMGLANARFYAPQAFFWDERAATLEDQVLMPIQDSVEMGMSLSTLVPKLQAVSFYPALFNAAFGDNTVTSDRISKALAQFVRSMVSSNSKFDQAYIAGTPTQPDFAGTFTAEERLGLALFQPTPGAGIQSLMCSACHATVVQALDAAHNNGLDANTDSDQGAGNGMFKSPSLRNIAIRPPFMHDGRFSTLEEVVEFYNSGIQDHPNLAPRLRDGQTGLPRRFNLSSAEKAALAAFLKTLTDESFLSDARYSDPFKKR
ncbi:MAG: hypothetical protein JKY46_02960 [Robiginitomaculum sp.]|nr:hypothetical protein [Robiginitomaculum sp.]